MTDIATCSMLFHRLFQLMEQEKHNEIKAVPLVPLVPHQKRDGEFIWLPIMQAETAPAGRPGRPVARPPVVQVVTAAKGKLTAAEIEARKAALVAARNGNGKA